MIEYISISAVTAAYGFALTATHFFYKRLKKVSKKTLAPSVRPLAEARRSFAPVSIWGHRPTVCFATTYMRWVRLRRTALRANPQMNTSTQPPEGAGGSRSKAAGELTLGLLSGEGRVYAALLWERACSRRRPDSRPVYRGCTQPHVGAAEGCDLLTLVFKIKRSQPRFTRQLLQSSVSDENSVCDVGLIVPTLPRGNAARDAPRYAFECLTDVSKHGTFPRIFQVVRRKQAL